VNSLKQLRKNARGSAVRKIKIILTKYSLPEMIWSFFALPAKTDVKAHPRAITPAKM
jgi:hypothetical protein